MAVDRWRARALVWHYQSIKEVSASSFRPPSRIKSEARLEVLSASLVSFLLLPRRRPNSINWLFNPRNLMSSRRNSWPVICLWTTLLAAVSY
ncbi:hypothetical protein BDZ89DRAFT_1060346 [Hymenopellis radicata]|nr:hypothetical protein BDZ89DRAFT_1060346 [Hymenopellis radicata]